MAQHRQIWFLYVSWMDCCSNEFVFALKGLLHLSLLHFSYQYAKNSIINISPIKKGINVWLRGLFYALTNNVSSLNCFRHLETLFCDQPTVFITVEEMQTNVGQKNSNATLASMVQRWSSTFNLQMKGCGLRVKTVPQLHLQKSLKFTH